MAWRSSLSGPGRASGLPPQSSTSCLRRSRPGRLRMRKGMAHAKFIKLQLDEFQRPIESSRVES